MAAMKKLKGNSRRVLVVGGAIAAGVASYAVYSGVVAGEPRRDEAPAVSAAPAALATGPMTAAGHGAHGHHPAPRPGVGPEHVVDPARYRGHPRIAAAYQAVAENAQLIDGLYCYCQCSEHAGHYSLLDCFASDHAAMCDICLNEAEMAVKLQGEGVGLDGIRDIIDQTYGS